MPLINIAPRWFTDWPQLGLIDLVLTTDPSGLWYLVPKSDQGEDWVNECLPYDGARTFSGGIPLEYESVSLVRAKAERDGLFILVR